MGCHFVAVLADSAPRISALDRTEHLCQPGLAFLAGFDYREEHEPPRIPKRSSASLLALSAATYAPTTFAAEKARRVGLIGAGWYGKSDLLRLMQVAPVEVVSAVTRISRCRRGRRHRRQRQKSGSSRVPTATIAICSRKRISTSSWSVRRIIGTRCTSSPPWKPAPMSIARSRSAATCAKARPCSTLPASTSAWCRSAPSARARRT